MADSNYAGMEDSPEGDSPPMPDAGKGGEAPEGTTALIPKTLLGGKEFKVGEEVVLKIVHEYEDEVEVEYAKEPEKPEAEKEPMSSDDEIEMMATPPAAPGGPGGY